MGKQIDFNVRRYIFFFAGKLFAFPRKTLTPVYKLMKLAAFGRRTRWRLHLPSQLGAKMTIELIALLPRTCLRGRSSRPPLAEMPGISIVIMIKVMAGLRFLLK